MIRPSSSFRVAFFAFTSALVFAGLHACEPVAECTTDDDCSNGLECIDGFCDTADEGEGEGDAAEGEGEGEGEEGEGEEGEGEEFCANGLDCVDDRDCAGGTCVPNAGGAGCCVPLSCTVDADCELGTCDTVRGLCVDRGGCASTGCPGIETVCHVNDEGQFCDVAPVASSCVIIDDGLVVPSGYPVTVRARASDEEGGPIRTPLFTWSSDSGAIDGDGILTVSCAGPAVCVVPVQAQAGDATCTANVRVFPELAVGDRRVIVVDELTRAPIAGVSVVALTQNATTLTATTDADGVALFIDADADVQATVTVMPADHDWHTIVDAPFDALVATRATPDPTTTSGLKGSFLTTLLHTAGDIGVGLTGLPLRGALLDLDPRALLGEVAAYNVEIEGVTDPGGTPTLLPSTLSWTLGAEAVKGDFVAFGDAPFGWSLGVKLRLADFGPIISQLAGGDDASLGLSLGALGHFMDTADAQVIPVASTSGSTPPNPSPGEPTPFATWPFDTGVARADVRSEFGGTWPVEDLPCASGLSIVGDCGRAPDLVVMTAARVPGVGLVPLGMGAELDFVDTQQIVAGYAPPHSGLEGSKIVHVAVALDLSTLVDGSGDGVGVSAIVMGGAALGFVPEEVPTFLDAPSGSLDVVTGTLLLEPGPAMAQRARMSGAGGRWMVWASANATEVLDLAALTDGASFADRTTSWRMDAFDMNTGQGPMETVFAPTNAPLELTLTRFNSEPCVAGAPTCTVE